LTYFRAAVVKLRVYPSCYPYFKPLTGGAFAHPARGQKTDRHQRRKRSERRGNDPQRANIKKIDQKGNADELSKAKPSQLENTSSASRRASPPKMR